MPFAIILGDDEQAQGQVRVKELGLEQGHAEKDGVLVDLGDLAQEVRRRLDKRRRERGDDGGGGVVGGGIQAVTEGVGGLAA